MRIPKIVAILGILALCGCTQQTEEQTADKLLAGTIWEYSAVELVPSSSTITESIAIPHYLSTAVNLCQIHIDTSYRTTQGCDTLKNITHSTTATLKFDNQKCLYNKTEQSVDSILSYTKQWCIISFEPGRYFTPDSVFVIDISTDHLKLGYKSALVPIGEIELQNASLERPSGFTYTNRLALQSINSENIEFEYYREDNDVYLQNERTRWVGQLNRHDWTLDVIQLSPDRKNIYKFELK